MSKRLIDLATILLESIDLSLFRSNSPDSSSQQVLGGRSVEGPNVRMESSPGFSVSA